MPLFYINFFWHLATIERVSTQCLRSILDLAWTEWRKTNVFKYINFSLIKWKVYVSRYFLQFQKKWIGNQVRIVFNIIDNRSIRDNFFGLASLAHSALLCMKSVWCFGIRELEKLSWTPLICEDSEVIRIVEPWHPRKRPRCVSRRTRRSCASTVPSSTRPRSRRWDETPCTILRTSWRLCI